MLTQVVPRFASAELPLKRSLLNGKMHVCADAALFHSRSFRVGWAPDLRSARLDASRASRVSLESVLASHFAGANPCVTLLSTCLQHAQRCSEAGVPTLKPTPGSRALVAMRSATEDLVARLKQSDVPHATLDHLAYMLKVRFNFDVSSDLFLQLSNCPRCRLPGVEAVHGTVGSHRGRGGRPRDDHRAQGGTEPLARRGRHRNGNRRTGGRRGGLAKFQ